MVIVQIKFKLAFNCSLVFILTYQKKSIHFNFLNLKIKSPTYNSKQLEQKSKMTACYCYYYYYYYY